MPRGDGTGPGGQGPMTGRGAGLCAGYSVPGYMNPVAGHGYGRRGRMGGGRGWRHWFYATGMPGWQRAYYGMPGRAFPAQPSGFPVGPPVARPAREEELDALKNQAGYFEEALAGIKERIEELEHPPGA